MRIKTAIGPLLVIGLLATTLTASAAEAKEKASPEMEAKIIKVIKGAYPEVEIKGVTKGTTEGLETYGVDFTSKGKKMDADVSADGTILGTEEAADLKSFPKAAAKVIKKEIKGTKVIAIEINRTFAKIVKDEKTGLAKVVKLPEPLIAYESDLEKNGQTGEVGVRADGTVVERPSWAKEKTGK